jgi:hypothetical protein
MSGNDERVSIYAPECPNCGRCYEWSTGMDLWILTKKSMLSRGIPFPVITFDADKKFKYYDDLIERIAYIKCNSCSTIYYLGEKMFNKLIMAIKANKGNRISRGINGMSFLWE